MRLGAVLSVLLAAASAAAAPAPSGSGQAESRAESERLIESGLAQRRAADYEGAVRSFVRAAELATAHADGALMARAYYEHADLLLETGEYRRAHEVALKSLAAAKEAGDAERAAWAASAVGNALFFMGDFTGAYTLFVEAARAMRQAGELYGEALARKDAGITARVLGRFDESMHELSAAADYFRAGNLRVELASTLQNIAVSYVNLGLLEKALEHYEEAIRVTGPGGKLEVIQGNHTRMGFLHLELGDPQRALEQFDLAAAANLARRLPLDGWLLGGRSAARSELGDHHGAVADRLQALERDRGSAPPLHLATDHHGLADLLWEREPERARAFLDRAIEIYLENDRDQTWAGRFSVGRAFRLRGDLDRAIEWFERAMNDLEATRGGLASDEWRSNFLHRHRSLYQHAFEARMERAGVSPGQGDEERAFEIFERAQARALNEAIATIAAASVTAVPSVTAMPGTASGSAPPSSPAPADSAPLGLAAVQQALPDDTALVAYFLTRARAFALVVGRDRLEIRQLGASPAELAARVRNYLDLVAGREEPQTWMGVGSRLYADLFAPLRPLLPPGTRRIVIIPDGALAYLPFETLVPAPARAPHYLLFDYAVSYAGSATVFARLARSDSRAGGAGSRRQADLLAFAAPARSAARRGRPLSIAEIILAERGTPLPPLAGTLEEVRRVQRFARRGSRVLVGDRATEEAVAGAAAGGAGSRILHFATHGIFVERNARLSALVLSPTAREDGLLEAREIYGLRLPAELVVLSGCETARGRLLRGEGVQGLARAFLYAGARSVLASLWNVEDRATARFMEIFYRHLADGEPVVDALRLAKIELARDPRSAAPRYWAPFVAIGAADRGVAISGPPLWQRHGWLLVLMGLVTGIALLVSHFRQRRR